MAERAIPARRGLLAHGVYVAGYGTGPRHGLHRFLIRNGRWEGAQLARVAELAALAQHPVLPVVYGVSGSGRGTVHSWYVSGDDAVSRSVAPSGGVEPCNLAVDPRARVLVVVNYMSGTLVVWPLAADGSLIGEGQSTQLAGSSIDPDRQEAAHPHQAFFADDVLYIVDLGADLVRAFTVSENGDALAGLSEVPVPPGTGPRHLVALPSGDLALTGELASVVLTGSRPGHEGDWRAAPSTGSTHPGRAGGPRNYPGDIQRSPDGSLVYVANRGYNTVAAFAVGAGDPRLIAELDSGVLWPQHLLVAEDDLLIAGRDSSLVTAMPLVNGVPSEQRTLFECPGAAWLQPVYDRRS